MPPSHARQVLFVDLKPFLKLLERKNWIYTASNCFVGCLFCLKVLVSVGIFDGFPMFKVLKKANKNKKNSEPNDYHLALAVACFVVVAVLIEFHRLPWPLPWQESHRRKSRRNLVPNLAYSLHFLTTSDGAELYKSRWFFQKHWKND